MRIGVVAVKVIVHCLHHRPWHLGAAGPVEIGNRITVMSACERRKTSPYFFNRHHCGGGRRRVLFLSYLHRNPIRRENAKGRNKKLERKALFPPPSFFRSEGIIFFHSLPHEPPHKPPPR